MIDADLRSVLAYVLLFVTGGGAVTWFNTIRSDRRETRKDDRDATRDKVDVVGTLMDRTFTQQQQITQLFDGQQAARADAVSARADAGAARAEVSWLTDLVRRTVGPIIQWLDDGAIPPPPAVPDDLRQVARALDQHTTGGPGPTTRGTP